METKSALILVLAAALLSFNSACAQKETSNRAPSAKPGDGIVSTGQLPREGLFRGDTLQAISIDKLVGGVAPGGVLILGEAHGNLKHHAHQRLALEGLAKTGRCTVSVGLEFLRWPHQAAISQYFNGTLPEDEFLKQAEWGKDLFSNYRAQALFPKTTGGELIGLNATAALTGAIKKRGVIGLTSDELQQMPPNFQLGSKFYRERFDAVMANHVPAAALDRYFEAQSTWDETMAWQAISFLSAHPTHCLAIIVGDFHAAWGGGLRDRLMARGASNITVISQVETTGLTQEELADEVGPHPTYGSRADGVWLSATASPPSP